MISAFTTSRNAPIIACTRSASDSDIRAPNSETKLARTAVGQGVSSFWVMENWPKPGSSTTRPDAIAPLRAAMNASMTRDPRSSLWRRAAATCRLSSRTLTCVMKRWSTTLGGRLDLAGLADQLLFADDPLLDEQGDQRFVQEELADLREMAVRGDRIVPVNSPFGVRLRILEFGPG